MSRTAVQAPPCDPKTLLGVCAGTCGRLLHRLRGADSYGACEDGHPAAECGIRKNRPLCSGCRKAARENGAREAPMLATYPKTRGRHEPPPVGPASGDQTWRTQAACRDEDPELFFPIHGGGPQRDAQVAEAKAVCGRCPVVVDCLAEALQRIPYGVAGGLDESERRQLIATGGRT